MGNVCCPKNSEDNSIGSKQKKGGLTEVTRARSDFSVFIKGINVVVKVGDIQREIADAIISGTDNFMKNRSSSFVTPETADKLNKEVSNTRGAASDEPLKNGQVVITGPAGFTNVQHVIHLAVPVWRGGQHQETSQLESGFVNALKEAARNGIESIIVTDIGSSLFGIPKQHTAAALIKAIKLVGDESTQNKKETIKTVKIVHKNELTVGIFENALKIEAGIPTDVNQSMYTDRLEGSDVATIDITPKKTQSNRILQGQ